jgi:hypothetical protein
MLGWLDEVTACVAVLGVSREGRQAKAKPAEACGYAAPVL